MENEYNRGKEIGELVGEVRSMNLFLQEHIKTQVAWNEAMNKRVNITEQWIQTTTGKVVILTAVFGIVGSLFYIAINWVISHFKI